MARGVGRNLEWFARGNAALIPLKRELNNMPISFAHEVAPKAAMLLTLLTRTAFASGLNVYGESRTSRYESATGKPLTLVDSGLTRDTLKFVPSGTIVRCVLQKKYMRYLIGKYGVLPNGELPVKWSRSLRVLLDREWLAKNARLAGRLRRVA